MPDSIFPNNWFSTHRSSNLSDGLFVVYAMMAPSREKEKNPTLIKEVGGKYKHLYEVKRDDLKMSLEGTGALLFDQENRKVYCSLSERANEKLFQEFVDHFNSLCKEPYKPVVFKASD